MARAKLKLPDWVPSEADMEWVEEKIREFRMQQLVEEWQGRALLMMSIRIPKKSRQQLEEEAKRLNLSMTSIMLAGLHTILPVLKSLPDDYYHQKNPAPE